MAKTKSKIRRYSALIHTILSGIYVITGILLLIFVLVEEGNLKRFENELVSLNETISVKQNSINEILAESDKIDHLEDDIEELKKVYFTNALEIEMKARNEEGDYKVAFLTFDDGPYVKTWDYLDLLKQYDIQATFFINKKTNSRYDETYQRYLIEGHTIGNHTASHVYKEIYSSDEAFIEDILENQEFIKEKLNYTTEVMRFPGGSYEATLFGLDKSGLVAKLNAKHYGYVDWNSMTGDGEGVKRTSDEYYHRVVDNIIEGQRILVVLMHDYSEVTFEALPRIIEELQSQGYIFLPLYYDSPTVKKQ